MSDPLVVSTDQQDYAPGSTAIITVIGLAAGATVKLEVDHTDDSSSGSGHDAWYVVDGGPGDLDGQVNGSITTSWFVDPDDSLGATFLLTATAAGADGQFGTTDDSVTTTTFTDSESIVSTTGITVTIDETSGLQNGTTPSAAGDADDNDTSLALPSAFSTRLSTLLGATVTTETQIGAALSGYDGSNTGSSAFSVTPAPGGTITELAFTGSTGAALNGLDSGLDTGGQNVLLYTDTQNNNILVGRIGGATGEIVFAAYIEETGTPVTGGKIWLVQYKALDHLITSNPDDSLNLLDKVYIGASQDLEFSLANAPSGQNLFLMFTQANPETSVDSNGVTRITSPTIIATGKDPANQSTGANITTGDTINTSQAGGPTTFGTNSQMITEQEGIRFTFVTGARADMTIPNLDQNEADVEANIDFTAMFGARTADFDIVQLQSGKTAQVRISAFSTVDEAGANFIDGYTNDTAVNISNVRVMNSAGQVIENSDGTANDAGITIAINGSVATLTGIRAGYSIQYTTATDHNRVLIENGAALNASGNNHADFDIGGFRLLQVSTATAEIGSKMIFEDDGPRADLGQTLPFATLTVDESNLNIDALLSVDPATFFPLTTSYGQDGCTTVSSSYSLELGVANGTASDLVDGATGADVLLYLEGGQVVGRAGAGGPIVFVVSLDSNNRVKLDQQRALSHPDTANADDTLTLQTNDLIKLTRTVTITDADGDTSTDSESINIGPNLEFKDDGPSITLSTVGSADALTVDETDLLTNASANYADNFTSAPNYGADGAGSITSAYALSVSSGGVDSGLDDVASGANVLLYLEGGQVVGRAGSATGAIVFTVSVSAAGVVSLDQQRALVHPVTTNPDDAVSPSAADLIRLTRTDTITDKDGDSSTGSFTLNIASTPSFKDDGPSITVSQAAAADALTVDESVLATDASVNYADNFANTPNYGADGAGTITSAYALSVKSAGVDSGLVDMATGQKVLLNLNSSGVVEGRAETGNHLVFTVSVSGSGMVTLDQQRAVKHPVTTNPDDAVTLSAADLIRLTRTDTITDKDGDTNAGSAFVNIGQALSFEDDGPSITRTSDLIYANSSNPTPGGTGIFDYSIGADSRLTFSASNTDFSAITLSGTVGAVAITNPSVTWASETSSAAVFNVQFTYQPDPASPNTTPATGTLTFDKVNDTYTVSLAAPISGFTVLTTGQALGFTGYRAGTSDIVNQQPDVSVAQLSSNFFVQFSGYSEPGGGTGANNLQALPPSANLGAADGAAFANGELFKQATTWVSVSNLANGVAGDTIQKGEVLDLDFFTANPTGNTTSTPTTQASGIFLKFDGIGSEDLVVVLKVIDASLDPATRTTKAIIIDNADIVKFGGTIPPGYGVVLDNNDGAVFIESNDFNAAGQHYLIEGAQLLVSTEGVTGTAIDLNAAIGTGGASTSLQEFQGTPGTANPEAATTDNDVIKISDIGFVTANSGTLNTNLSFSLQVVDADGDATATQTLDVGIVSGTTFTGGADAEAIQGMAGNDAINGGGGNDVLTGGFGKDYLTGGAGNDTFDFNLAAESAAGTNRDAIVDFVSGTDKIDLSGIDAIAAGGGVNDAFAYVGAGNFTNVAGQLRFDTSTGTLQGDTNGDGAADFEVQMVGVNTPLPGTDFIL